MSEQEDTGFKITDRRKYNPDGSPREASDSVYSPASPEAEIPRKTPESTNNVVSFPTEAAPKQAGSEAPAQAADVEAAAAPAADKAAATAAERDYKRARGPASAALPEASFLGLVNMLAVEAAMHLGLLRNPGEEPQAPDLESGRHLIDMIGMLQTKTRGNLTSEEDNLLENVLADLRMQFVAISGRR